MGISGNNPANTSSLEDQGKQQINFFVIRFTVKYSDWLVRTAALKVRDLQFLKVLGSVQLSLRLSRILEQFVTPMLFSGHLKSVLHNPQQQYLLSDII